MTTPNLLSDDELAIMTLIGSNNEPTPLSAFKTSGTGSLHVLRQTLFSLESQRRIVPGVVEVSGEFVRTYSLSSDTFQMDATGIETIPAECDHRFPDIEVTYILCNDCGKYIRVAAHATAIPV